jgi:hypothetical protein
MQSYGDYKELGCLTRKKMSSLLLPNIYVGDVFILHMP